MFQRALVRRPGPDLADGITTADLGAPDLAEALRQHDAYVAALRDAGLAVAVLDALPDHPDACFVEDAAIVFPHLAVITRPGAMERRGETASIAEALEVHRPLVYVKEPGTLDGGDVLVVGRRVYVGLSERTDADGAEALRTVLEPAGYVVTVVEVGEGLHLKSSVNHLGGDVLLTTPEFADLPEFADHERLVADPAEAYACNTLWVNGHLLHPAGFPRTRALLDGLDLPVVELHLDEYRKLDGGLTCLSLRF